MARDRTVLRAPLQENRIVGRSAHTAMIDLVPIEYLTVAKIASKYQLLSSCALGWRSLRKIILRPVPTQGQARAS
jgi:hypothetical protein